MAEAKHEQMHQPGAEHAAGRMQGMQAAATEGITVVRDLAADTLRAAGEVGTVAVGATRDILVEVADGMRDVLSHIVSAAGGIGRGRPQPPQDHK